MAMQCSNCASEIPAGKKFCTQCGTPAPIACPSCGSANAVDANFCGDCGRRLGDRGGERGSGPAISQRVHDPATERRQLTVMFCDLVGSTELATRMDPEEMRDVIARYRATVADTVSQFDGFVAQYLGDGVLAYFGYPVAHEDDAERA